MIPVEKPETINRRLVDHYGKTEDKANYRLVWSEDEFEMRETEFTPEGFHLLRPEVRLLPKYKQYIQDRFILERLTVVPTFQQHELPKDVLSYEPIWVFEDPRTAEIIRPAWMACKFIIDNIHKNIEGAGMYTKYKHPDAGLNPEQLVEKKRAELQEVEQSLFANETETGDALAYREGVGFTTSKIKES